VEAAAKSGALVTARLALDQGRDVLAIPGGADSELSYGPNDLIKQGAIPVTGVDDILDNFRWSKPGSAARPRRDTSGLSGEELSIYNILTIAPTHLDELGRRTKLGPARIAELLLKLEIKGYILRKPGNIVVRA
jgi:DNA processing protein